MNEKLNWKVLFILAIVWFPLWLAFFWHVIWSYTSLKAFFWVEIISWDYLKNVFTTIMWLLLCAITLFTPTKKLKSPLTYLASEIVKKWDSLGEVTNDKDKRNNIYIEIIIYIIYLIATSSAYYYIIKNIVKYNTDYTLAPWVWILTVFLFLIIVAIFVIFTSFIVWKLEDLDEDTFYDINEKRQQKTYWSIWLMVWIIVSIWLWNYTLKTVDKYIKDPNRSSIIKSIYETLWWDTFVLQEWLKTQDTKNK